MLDLYSKDTIAALSTPVGKGAIAVIRLGGETSLEIANQIFSKSLSRAEHQLAIFGKIVSRKDDRTIDQVIVTCFFAPHSFTGEDLIEINCHANTIIIDEIMSELVGLGARMALPGEFAQRAFLNGKIDLAQAEAISQLIDAKTRDSLRQSMKHLEGKYSAKINNIQSAIIDLASLIEVSLDFTEEDIEIYDRDAVSRKADTVIGEIHWLLRSFTYGHFLNDGVNLLLLGKPNVGKSSILNTLLGKERAIVSHIPGTTRDYIEGRMEIYGMPVNLVDTAGVRNSADPIEEEGVQRAIKQIEFADLVLAIFDRSREIDGDDQRLLDIYRAHRGKTSFILINNKCDLPTHPSGPGPDKNGIGGMVEISALSGQGLSALKDAIHRELIPDQGIESEDVVVTNLRHKEALARAAAGLSSFKEHLLAGYDEAILASELRGALDDVGEIVGATTAEDLLNNIFGQFCIGK